MAVSKVFAASQSTARVYRHHTVQTGNDTKGVRQHKSARINYRALRQIKMENLENGGRIRGGPVRHVLAWLARLDKNVEVHDTTPKQKNNTALSSKGRNDPLPTPHTASTSTQPLPPPAEAPIDPSLFTPDSWCHWDEDYCMQQISGVVAFAHPKKKIATTHERKHEAFKKSMATSPLRKCFSLTMPPVPTNMLL